MALKTSFHFEAAVLPNMSDTTPSRCQCRSPTALFNEHSPMKPCVHEPHYSSQSIDTLGTDVSAAYRSKVIYLEGEVTRRSQTPFANLET